MIDYNALARQSHEIMLKGGWPERDLDEDIALMHSELSEALEDYRNNRKLDELYYEAKVENDGVIAMQELTSAELQTWDEKVEEYGRGGKILSAKPCGIPVELADVVIRIAQHMGTQKYDMQHYIAGARTGVAANLSFCSFITAGHKFLSKAAVFSGLLPSPFYLACCCVLIEEYCRQNRIDLAGAILLKAKYNMTRPPRHGGKKI